MKENIMLLATPQLVFTETDLIFTIFFIFLSILTIHVINENIMKDQIKKIFRWIFSEELNNLEKQSQRLDEELNNAIQIGKHLEHILNGVGVAVDVNLESKGRYSGSWAAICIQGERHDFVKFVDLRESEIRDIHRFLQNFDREKRCVDAPHSAIMNGFLKF